ncbi:MAG: tRNA (N6-threonylcarbamoyladenosine(37)-N6)-methyltransferase TrmO [Anaerolineae bacterium]
MDPITLHPVGVVHNDVRELVEVDWAKVVSEIHIDAAYAPGLAGLEDWSHVVVLYVMHRAAFDISTDLVRRPQGNDALPALGIFAQRARRRPNLIGTTAVKLLSVEGNIVRVRGLDAIDGTPVVDIKPYAPVYDGVMNPLVPAWFMRLMQGVD